MVANWCAFLMEGTLLQTLHHSFSTNLVNANINMFVILIISIVYAHEHTTYYRDIHHCLLQMDVRLTQKLIIFRQFGAFVHCYLYQCLHPIKKIETQEPKLTKTESRTQGYLHVHPHAAACISKVSRTCYFISTDDKEVLCFTQERSGAVW